jgi:large subunit ribosomal protein L14
MKPVSARVTRGLQVGSLIKCADNTGARTLNIISVKGYKGVKSRHPSCGVSSWIICSVRGGIPKMKKEVVNAVVIRQKKEYRRKNGMRVQFEDNAAILINDKGEPRGTKIKGPVAKEAVERFSMIGKISTIVI